MAAHAPRRPARLLAYPVAAVAAGVISGEWRADGAWRLLALWAGRSDFGVDDPLFGRDVGFFVFSLPLYEWVSRWMLDALVMAAVATVVAYAAAGGLRIARARAHLLVLGALALVVVAWRYRLDAYALAVPHGERAGAGYTEAHVRLPALRILACVSLAGAALLLYAAVRRVPRRPLVAVAAVAALALTLPGVVSRVVERVEVAPQALARERPYVEHAIAGTRRAFALDRVDVRNVTGGELSHPDIDAHHSTLENVPLWDQRVLRPAMDDLQSIGRYYSFPSLTLDRYASGVFTLAARQLDLRALGRDARGWANDRFAYTHGYGVVAVSAPRADRVGEPRFTEHEFGPDVFGLREPRVYYSERTGPAPPYLVVNSRRAEVDRPSGPDYHYAGSGGIALSSPLRRVAFAIRFGDTRLLLTETATDRSRIVLHRDVQDRLRTLAPFLRWDSHPQTVVADGRVQFLFHGYTTSESFPYSTPLPSGVNYMRAGAVAAVDGFDGRIALYADDARRSDPARVARRVPEPVRAGLGDAGRAARAPALPAPPLHRAGRAVRDLPRGRADRVLERRGRLAGAAADRGTARGRGRDPLPRADAACRRRSLDHAGPLSARPAARRRRRALRARHPVLAARAPEPRRLPGGLDRPRRGAGAHAAQPAARPARARARPGHAQDPRRRGGEPAAPDRQPRVARPRRGLGEPHDPRRAAGGAGR